MGTYFDGFHEDDQVSGNSFLPLVDEVTKDQLGVLESIKADEEIVSAEKNIKNLYSTGKEDIYQIMSDWQQHDKFLQMSNTEDLEVGLGLETNRNALNMYSSGISFEDNECSILSKALKSPVQKFNATSSRESKKRLIIENMSSSFSNVENCQKLCELFKGENGLLGKVTVLNGEKKIFIKNIVGLHCLNEIKENPNENCQVTSTIINGKRYKIIIKPKSLKMKKLSNDRIKKTLIKKLMQCNLGSSKNEPEEDKIISEMSNGNYDVPILGCDVSPIWDLVNLDSEWNPVEVEDNCESQVSQQPEPERSLEKFPLHITIPKLNKKSKTKTLGNKSDEEVDIETVNPAVEGQTLGSLLKNFESEVAKLQKNDQCLTNGAHESAKGQTKLKKSIKNNSPNEAIERIEALRQKKENRIPLIHTIPFKKTLKCCTRMQDAVATLNRLKLLKIVSGGDTISLEHDYCSAYSARRQLEMKNIEINYLMEKNPKKDSGMESEDVSDTSEGANAPEFNQNQKVEKPQKCVTKFIKISNKSCVGLNSIIAAKEHEVNSVCDLVKTEAVSNGSDALTHNSTNTNSECDISNYCTIASKNSSHQEDENVINQHENKKEHSKKKLKLEEYLSHRNGEISRVKRGKRYLVDERQKNNMVLQNQSNQALKDGVTANNELNRIFVKVNPNTKKKHENSLNSGVEEVKKCTNETFIRSPSASLDDKRSNRKKRKSSTRCQWRRSGSSSGSNDNKLEEQEKHHHSRWYASREKKSNLNFRSYSSSRSPSRESSTSSDYGSPKLSGRYQQKSVSKSSSQEMSRSFWSGSPHNKYCMREKQLQIEERRVIYVGRIEEGMTKAKLKKRFSIFGPIVDISLHFREYGDNYGFVTYAYKSDAYVAVEHGNDDPSLPRYDLCFGGRRRFCKEKYADLDGMPTSYSGFSDTYYRGHKESFDLLLKEAQAKLKNRKKP